MKNILVLLTGCILWPGLTPLYAQDFFAGYEHLFTPPCHYTTFRTGELITIDGKMDENAWSGAAWSDYFTDIEGDSKKAPPLKTRFKLLWDSQFVYIGVQMEEPHIWANIKQHDAIIYHDNDFEVFLDPDGDTHHYFEVEVNAHNTVFDLFMPKPYRSGGMALLNWDVQHLRSGVSIQGTLNKPDDRDTGWFVEMAIPFRSVSLGNSVQVPKEGTYWRINFSRVEWEVDIQQDRYIKRRDKLTGKSLPESNWVWSPQGVVNMHLPERWGYLHFSTQQSRQQSAERSLPPEEKLKKYLWLVFYKQQAYSRRHKRYSTTLKELALPNEIRSPDGNINLHLEATSRQFNLTARYNSAGESLQINQEGKISKYINQ